MSTTEVHHTLQSGISLKGASSDPLINCFDNCACYRFIDICQSNDVRWFQPLKKTLFMW